MSGLPTFDPGFSTDELARIYSAGRTVGAMLEFEEALALALADAGIAPMQEAEKVAAACHAGIDHPDDILASTWEAGTPIIALRESVLPRIAGEDARRWFHFGATSQDTIDTAQMIQAAEALESMTSGLASIAGRLRELTVKHRDRIQMGRTFLQDARPTTFGFRMATWLDAVLSQVESLRTQRASLVVQLGGPVGTMEEYGDDGPAVIGSLATHLGLGVPDICWHGDRDRIWTLAQSVSRTARALSKMTSDLALLSSSGVAEIRVRSGGSSSMPGKKNPIDSVRAIAAASACSGAVGMLAAAPPIELDRGVGGWHTEWVALPLTMQSGAASVEATARCLASLEIDGDAMSAGIEAAPVSGVAEQIDNVLERSSRILG